MEDVKIVEMYWERSETAIEETQKKYGKYCYHIAYNILYSNEDSEECVNDTYLRAWNSMPPHRPQRLQTFLGKIVRNVALDRYDKKTAVKRMSGIELAIEELAECVPDVTAEVERTDDDALRSIINSFLESLVQRDRMIFMRRYWYLSSIADIASDFGASEGNIKVILHRTRNKLKEHLVKEGIEI